MCKSLKRKLVRISKNLAYENPYSVTGTIKLTGSEQNPKNICTDMVIGTRKGIGHSRLSVS